MPKSAATPPRQPGKNDPQDEPDSRPVEPAEAPLPAVVPDDAEQQCVSLSEG